MPFNNHSQNRELMHNWQLRNLLSFFVSKKIALNKYIQVLNKVVSMINVLTTNMNIGNYSYQK